MTDQLVTTGGWEHYRIERQPRSSGRVLLSEALIEHATLSWG